MAIFHLSVKTVSRSTGRSAVAAAAYRAGTVLTNERDGVTHDYARRQGVEDAFIAAPDGAEWAHDRSRLWNAAEQSEKRKNSTVAREYVLALPSELDEGERKEMARTFAAEVVARYGVAADVAIHRPSGEGDNRNHHAHILTTTRVVGADGLGEKTRVLDAKATGSDEVEHLRALWASMVNNALERHQIEDRVDHRSHARRQIDARPTVHMGPSATAMEREALKSDEASEPVTERGRMNAAIREGNALLDSARAAMQAAESALASLKQTGLFARRVAGKLGRGLARLAQAKAAVQASTPQPSPPVRPASQPDNTAPDWLDRAAAFKPQQRAGETPQPQEKPRPSAKPSRDSGPSMG